jgi:CRP/FNR family transcriptional regulator
VKKNQIESAWKGAERCKNCAIRHLVLFADIEQHQFDNLHLPIDDIEYDAGHRLYYQGDKLPYVYTVRSGLIKLVQRLPNGDRRIVRLLGQGDLAGLESLEGLAMDHDAITMDRVQVCRIPKKVIDMLRKETPVLHDAVLKRWQKALHNANTWITRLSTGNSRERVARLLLLLDEASEEDSFFLPTRDDMGAMLGITTESASKATAEFKRKGWLKPLQQSRACIDRLELTTEYDSP